jgi:hypothetical protein
MSKWGCERMLVTKAKTTELKYTDGNLLYWWGDVKFFLPRLRVLALWVL